ncbi:LysM peptidoglycan-binding domain-containing protein [Anaerotignum lactatifermentans]|uniref:LysM peptidoglycan-binding domain-containing protein n=1 Tax=Anaerotignum lactatifermentans TaxID=160404 RepID=A0ABS2GB30_9FIRM|nr:LysM peptidoglycan-binding domain-containing protein [Anaerotignum lactatifermentans]MBM6830171.1 LysM peptidoglycan-binding domain-containing protein [Anaerotignum lactatifermentans]MBM6878684.1 LysM peptidoglycan-binding domain-containing protein [Anaerotignum lactatifermentans]MBM6951784.1 LysM peptidoglycan-binding domain-containing protein [Anaerotignum lactatifermentans]
MDGRRRRRMVRKSKKARKNVLVLLTLALIVGLGTIAMGAQGGKEGSVCYESVLIHTGDTLWSIAEEYKSEGEKTEHMIDDILKLNGIKTTKIRSGEHILVPVEKAS